MPKSFLNFPVMLGKNFSQMQLMAFKTFFSGETFLKFTKKVSLNASQSPNVGMFICL